MPYICNVANSLGKWDAGSGMITESSAWMSNNGMVTLRRFSIWEYPPDENSCVDLVLDVLIVKPWHARRCSDSTAMTIICTLMQSMMVPFVCAVFCSVEVL